MSRRTEEEVTTVLRPEGDLLNFSAAAARRLLAVGALDQEEAEVVKTLQSRARAMGLEPVALFLDELLAASAEMQALSQAIDCGDDEAGQTAALAEMEHLTIWLTRTVDDLSGVSHQLRSGVRRN